MNWWIWLGIIAAIITILTGIDRLFRPIFSPICKRIFKDKKKTDNETEVALKGSLVEGNDADEYMSIKIPVHDRNVRKVNINLTIEYFDGLPTSEKKLRDKFEKATSLKQTQSYVEAIELYKESLKITVSSGQEIAIFIQIGKCYFEILKYVTAEEYFEKAIELADKVKDEKGIESALLNLGVVYYMQDKLNDALSCLEQALETNQKTKNYANKARILGNIGIIYKAQDKNKKALATFKNVISMNKSIRDKEIEGFACYFIGSCYYGENKKKSVKYFKIAREVFREIGKMKEEAVVLDAMGLTYLFIIGEKTVALEYFEEALKICREVKDKMREVRILDNIALIYMMNEDSKKAIEYLEQSAKIDIDEADVRHNFIIAFYYRMIGDKKKEKEYLEMTRSNMKEIKKT